MQVRPRVFPILSSLQPLQMWGFSVVNCREGISHPHSQGHPLYCHRAPAPAGNTLQGHDGGLLLAWRIHLAHPPRPFAFCGFTDIRVFWGEDEVFCRAERIKLEEEKRRERDGLCGIPNHGSEALELLYQWRNGSTDRGKGLFASSCGSAKQRLYR